MSTTIPLQVASALLAGPAGTPPPGVMADFHHPASLRREVYVLVILALVLTTLAVLMRLFTSWNMRKTFVVEDGMVLLAWALEICYAAACFVCEKYGAGTHMWEHTLAAFIESTKWINVAQILYCPIMILLKVAILAQFLRIFAPTRHVDAPMFFACWTLIVVITLYYTITFGLNISQCTPREKIWNPLVAGHCITSLVSSVVVNGWVNVFSDAVILFLPLPCIFKLNLKLEKKLAVASVFLLGVLACIASILRLYYTYRIVNSTDASYHYAVVGICTLYEICLGALVVCLPVVPRFLRLVREKWHGSVGSKNRSESLSSGPRAEERSTWANKALGRPRAVAVESIGIASVKQYLGRGPHSSGGYPARIPSESSQDSGRWEAHMADGSIPLRHYASRDGAPMGDGTMVDRL